MKNRSRILIVCDVYKADKLRKRFIEKDYKVVMDEIRFGMHHFSIECDTSVFKQIKKELQGVLTQLEIELKLSN